MPSLRNFASDHGVSRFTVAQAYGMAAGYQLALFPLTLAAHTGNEYADQHQ